MANRSPTPAALCAVVSERPSIAGHQIEAERPSIAGHQIEAAQREQVTGHKREPPSEAPAQMKRERVSLKEEVRARTDDMRIDDERSHFVVAELEALFSAQLETLTASLRAALADAETAAEKAGETSAAAFAMVAAGNELAASAAERISHEHAHELRGAVAEVEAKASAADGEMQKMRRGQQAVRDLLVTRFAALAHDRVLQQTKEAAKALEVVMAVAAADARTAVAVAQMQQQAEQVVSMRFAAVAALAQDRAVHQAKEAALAMDMVIAVNAANARSAVALAQMKEQNEQAISAHIAVMAQDRALQQAKQAAMVRDMAMDLAAANARTAVVVAQMKKQNEQVISTRFMALANEHATQLLHEVATAVEKAETRTAAAVAEAEERASQNAAAQAMAMAEAHADVLRELRAQLSAVDAKFDVMQALGDGNVASEHAAASRARADAACSGGHAGGQ
ncbi:hypothetical protein T492DRAFT_977854 [Pavlovales sp. CCMP2436]|nr:hypothetical protein T492DRAFT_866037 [Pavlovales sp. CCMP2436]KAJ1633897.1 hypothetical protein T492DRAFT_977854 [Pavlovales sp. CCMP2436]